MVEADASCSHRTIHSMRTIVVLVASAAAAVLLAGCGGSDSSDSTKSAAGGGSGPCTYTSTGDAAKKVSLPPSEPDPAQSLTITTNRGAIAVKLNDKATPCTVNSFTSLAKQGFFDQTKCHRLTTEGIFVLQCGDPTASGSGGPGYAFPDELTGQESYPAGTLAMANAGPDTNGSQFFLVYADTGLPPSYTVFGTFGASSIKVVQDIAKAGTADGGGDGAPKSDVVISSVK
ncbi:peptidylprolyl isomerase [soil metagenome]